MEIINEKLKETHRNCRNLGLGVRFKSCVMVQAPAQFGTHKNDPSKYSGFVTPTQILAGKPTLQKEYLPMLLIENYGILVWL